MTFISKHASLGAIVRVFSLLLATMCILMLAGTRAQGSSAPERKGTVIVTDRSGVRVLAGDSAGSTTESALFRYPAPTGGTLDSTDLISRVERALSSYAASCATGDEKAMAEVFTGFAVIAYASDIPGRFIASDAINLPARA